MTRPATPATTTDPALDRAAEDLLRRAYAAFNARDAHGALALMDPDVDWPNAMEGNRALGHDQVRKYWLLQWSQTEPHVEPRSFSALDDGRVAVEVHQVVRSKTGEPIIDRTVRHVYTLSNGLVSRMDIEDLPA
jgi:ketosteroid isomerase-like protein